MEAPAGGDYNRGPAVVAILWTEAAISITVLALRIWGRCVLKKFGWDDTLMILTVMLMVAFSSVSTYLAHIGGFRHLFYLTPEQQGMAVKVNWISQPFVIFGYATGKCSIALLIISFLGPGMKAWRYMLYTLMGLTCVITALDIILTYVQCSPTKALWTPALQATPGVCWDPSIQSNYAIFTSAWNIFMDCVLAIVPTFIIWPLQLSLAKKLGLMVLLGSGLLAAVMGGIKTSYLANLTARSDLTWMTFPLYTYSAGELFVMIVCGCAPGLRGLYDVYFGSTSRSQTGYSSYKMGSTPTGDRSLASRKYSNVLKSTDDADDVYLSADHAAMSGGNARSPYATTKGVRIEVRSASNV